MKTKPKTLWARPETQERVRPGISTVNGGEHVNATQCDALAVPLLPEHTHAFTPIETCEYLLNHMPNRPGLLHDETRAYYMPQRDLIRMPRPELFGSTETYYSTLYHELGHSTGHESRLNRSTLKDAVKFGDVSYAQEELIAEMTAAYLCGVCGIANLTVDNSAAYLAGWLRVLQNDPKMLVQAAGQAQKAADFIQGLHLDVLP